MSVPGNGEELPPQSSAIGAIIRKSCPRCRRGQVFRSLWKMNDRCPLCGLDFDRGDPGYFTGAMYISYAMAIPLLTILTVIEYFIFPRWSLFQLVLLAAGISTPLIPWIWQYSRVLWSYFDRYFDPDEDADERHRGANHQND